MIAAARFFAPIGGKIALAKEILERVVTGPAESAPRAPAPRDEMRRAVGNLEWARAVFDQSTDPQQIDLAIAMIQEAEQQAGFVRRVAGAPPAERPVLPWLRGEA